MLKITTLQKELILAGIRCLKPNGVLVYSTCSVLMEENEAVAQYALNKCSALRLAETGLTFGVDAFTRFRQHRFHPNMKFAKRFYPHQHNMDGFFLAKFRLCGPAKFDTDNTNKEEVQVDGAKAFFGSAAGAASSSRKRARNDDEGGAKVVESNKRHRLGMRDRKKLALDSKRHAKRFGSADRSIVGDKQRERSSSAAPNNSKI